MFQFKFFASKVAPTIQSSHCFEDIFKAYYEACENLNVDPAAFLRREFLLKSELTKFLGRGYRPYQNFNSVLCETFWDNETKPYINEYDKTLIMLWLAGTKLMDFEYQLLENH